MSATTRRPFSTSLCSALAAGTLLLSGIRAVRADDLLEKVRRENAVLAQELKIEARKTLVEAITLARRDPAGAAGMLKRFRVRIEDNKVLTADERARYLKTFDSYITRYDRGATRATQRETDQRTREALIRERRQYLTQQSEKSVGLQRGFSRMYELQRQGKFDEAYRVSRDLSRKYGRSPALGGIERTSSFNDSLRTVRSLRDERDRRYVLAMRQVVRSSMPIIGDVEFPKDWKQKTLRRRKQLLTAEEKKLIRALMTPITTTIKDKPLQGVLDYFQKTTGLKFEVDKAALEELMINYETPVKGEARGITTRTFLKRLFGDIGLTYVVRNGSLYITTPARASQMLVVKTYYIGDLLGLTDLRFGPAFNQLQMVQNVAALINFIQSIEPTSWQAGGGSGTIVFNPLAMALIVKQTAEMQFMLSGGLAR